jgi:hypothetical protein
MKVFGVEQISSLSKDFDDEQGNKLRSFKFNFLSSFSLSIGVNGVKSKYDSKFDSEFRLFGTKNFCGTKKKTIEKSDSQLIIDIDTQFCRKELFNF